MRPADAYRLKYRSSSQNSMETETNETAEARVVDELRALELDDIARAARERDRRAAHMRLPPPHKLEELGLSDSGGPGLPVDVFKKLFYEGDKDAVVAWFDATGPRDINETFTLTEPHLAKRVGAEPVSGHTLLALVAHAPAYYSGHVALVRWLLACGADPKIRNADGWSPLDFACTSHEVMYSPSYNFTPNRHEIIMLLIAGGAEGNALIPSKYYPDDPTAKRYSPLGELLTLMWGRNSRDTQFRGLEFVCRALLRAGASLDNCTNEEDDHWNLKTAEWRLDKAAFETRQLAVWQKCSILVREVRAAGGGRFSHALSSSAPLSCSSSAAYKACFLRPRKQILVLRALALKGRAKTSNAVLGFVFGLPNGVAWNVLSFWQCYYRIRTPNSSGCGGPDDTHWHTGPW